MLGSPSFVLRLLMTIPQRIDAAPQLSLSGLAMAQKKSRLDAIDALRGLALLGVLLINLETEFRSTFFQQFQMADYGSAADRIARNFLAIFVEFKAITIFSMLFGVGLAMQRDALVARGRVGALLLRRMIVLLGFGLLHMFFIWNGDILVEYALVGILALPFLLRSARISGIGALVAMMVFLAMPVLPLAFPSQFWINEHVTQATQVYGHGSFTEIARLRLAEVPSLCPYLINIFPRTMALVLFGVWAWQSGLLRSDRLQSSDARVLGIAALILGLAMTFANAARPETSHLLDAFAPILLALGYACLALPLFANKGIVVGWLAAVGRMAFTNYLSQSVILGMLFYGYGLGMMGKIGVIEGMAIGLAVFGLQITFSQWWLSRHAYGPLEWVWRSLMYGQRQAWRRTRDV